MKTNKKQIILSCLAIAGSVILYSCSNNSPSQDSKEHAEEMNEERHEGRSEKDADKLVELHQSNLFEIQASQDAAGRASSAEVKKLALMMVEAHTKMDRDMQDLASRKNVTLPGDITNAQKDKLGKLREKTGMDYDKEYADLMKNGHEEAISGFEQLSERAEDPEIKQMASATLPEIRTHLDMVEATRENIKDMKTDARKDEKGRAANSGTNETTVGDGDVHDARPVNMKR